jgi:hypothetical protein
VLPWRHQAIPSPYVLTVARGLTLDNRTGHLGFVHALNNLIGYPYFLNAKQFDALCTDLNPGCTLRLGDPGSNPRDLTTFLALTDNIGSKWLIRQVATLTCMQIKALGNNKAGVDWIDYISSLESSRLLII